MGEPYTLEQQIAEVQRELAMRRRVYPKWIADKKLSQDKADQHMACMEAALESLYRLKGLEK